MEGHAFKCTKEPRTDSAEQNVLRTSLVEVGQLGCQEPLGLAVRRNSEGNRPAFSAGRFPLVRASGAGPTALAILQRERVGRMAAATYADMLNQGQTPESCYGTTQFTIRESSCDTWYLFGEPVTNPVVPQLFSQPVTNLDNML
jgi:hypothetical protein